MIHATHQQLFDAYKKHSKAGSGSERSHALLKFYAAECGLKAYFLRSGNLKDTKQLIDNGGTTYGHDIVQLIRQCKIPNLGTSPLEKFGGEAYLLKHLHEYLRYHATIPRPVITAQVAFLDEIIEVLKNK